MIYDAARDFIKMEAGPRVHELAYQRALMSEAASQGFTAMHIDEQYGGLSLNVLSNTVMAEGISTYGGAFNTTIAAHIGIGMLPIYFFGSEDQKTKYLPPLAKADMIASYCLTEPGSGSDALAAKTEARLTEDGKYYVLNGQKMWITNAGFADLFIVFAKINGKEFTCFLVEADTPGIQLGAEEDKMGIKGSSTRQVFFENVKVPSDQILGEIGKGHLIAFNVLNIGRFKLGIMCLGGALTILQRSLAYAFERHQFGQAIASFGAIKYKLAEQFRRIFTLDSLTYRVANMLDIREQYHRDNGQSHAGAAYHAAREMALECAVLKVAGSECVDYCADENIQIHGGMGFSEETDAPLIYRNARINRIYEGTNEINRLLVVSRLGKLASDNHEGFFELLSEAYQRFSDSETSLRNADEDDWIMIYETYREALVQLIAFTFTSQAMGEVDLVADQQTTMELSDLVIEWLLTESSILRLGQLKRNQHDFVDHAEAACILQMNGFHHLMIRNSRQIIFACLKDPEASKLWLEKWHSQLNWKVQHEAPLRDKIADTLIERQYYLFRDVPS